MYGGEVCGICPRGGAGLHSRPYLDLVGGPAKTNQKTVGTEPKYMELMHGMQEAKEGTYYVSSNLDPDVLG